MTKAQHTPSGQIRLAAAVGTTGTNENPLFWSIEKVADDGRYLCELAHIHGGGGSAVSQDERDANAKLFLAAPDLLEALEDAVAWLVELAESGDAGYWNPDEDPLTTKCRAAIAKAKREPQ